MLKVGLRFLNTGYCKALERITLRQGGWRLIRCPALVALIEHPTQGAILFDTGYASHVLNESRRFPLRLYRSITPMHFTPEQSAAAQLHRLGVGEVSTIVLSHFHADHVGGLKDFPGARFVYLKEAYDAVHGRSGWNALRKAFIPGLIPEDFLERSDVITDATPRVALPYESFPWGYDLLGDHSLVGVPLPGHADGQMGLWIPNSDQGPVFLVAFFF
ncbi:MAG: MBL fold metallo-hydrolase, partial [Chlamydiia bacterium]|nr:MBL fold metallo-hydrolase [Chlamydiia bacterium]